MKKEERLNILNKILEIYKNNTISIQSLSKRFHIAPLTIKNFLLKNGCEINIIKATGKSNLENILHELNTESINDISKKYNISEKVLLLSQTNISTSEFKKLIIQMAVDEYIHTSRYSRSIVKISEKYGINKKTLKKYLSLNNIKTEHNYNKSNFNRNIFDIIDTEEKAYWLGFMYADGYISAKGKAVGLNLSIKDIDHLKKFNKFLNYDKGMNIYETHQFGSKLNVNKNGETLYMVLTVINDQDLWNGLYSKGCVPNKTLVLTFPSKDIVPDNLIKHFIRGYFDGDGTIGMYRHSKTNPNMEESIMFVGTKQFLEKIQEYLGKGFLMQKPNCNKNIYRLGYSTKKANNAAKLMYENSNIYLNRKYDIYINKFAAVKSSKIGKC